MSKFSSDLYDAMAGELMSHQTCWNKIIVQRVPEVKHTAIGNALDLHSPNTSVVPSDIISFDSPPSQALPESIFTSPVHDQTFNEPFGSPVYDSSIQQIVISELMGGIELALHDKQVLTVRNVVEVYETRMSEFGITESRDYSYE